MEITNENEWDLHDFFTPRCSLAQKGSLSSKSHTELLYIYYICILVNIFLDISSYSPFDTSKYIKVMLYIQISLSPTVRICGSGTEPSFFFMAPSWHPNEALTFIFKNACGTTTCWGSLVSQCFPSRLRSMGDLQDPTDGATVNVPY